MNRWVPYPFQNNIRYLPLNKVAECLLGLIQARTYKIKPNNFKEWTLLTFGKGIAKYFMFPHNRKIWTHPLEEMSYDWIGERISTIDIKRIFKNIIFSQDDTAWGPNSRFKFPLFGGTGEIFRRFIPYIQGHLFLNKEVIKIDIENKEIIFSDSQKVAYNILINTLPLDRFIEMAGIVKFFDIKKYLRHNSVLVVGLGIKNPSFLDKCWVYFPESNCPFYRITYFSNYSPGNVPSSEYSSLICETAYSEYKPYHKDKIIEDTIQGLINTKILSKDDKDYIVSRYLIDAEYAYPIPTLNRDKVLEIIQPYLEQRDIYSRGRFGAWRYEVGNMDHCVMQGKSIVDSLLKIGKS
jgi:protoporphyrinogen oxidase